MQRKFKYLNLFLCFIFMLSACSNPSQGTEETKNTKTKQVSSEKIISNDDKEKLKTEVIKFFSKYGEDKGLAISNRYITSSFYEEGDAYATTTDGEIQITNNDIPGWKAFKVHNVVGITAYHSKHHVKGYADEAKEITNIQGFREVADMNKPITKYLFADNGKVYQCQFKSTEDTTLSTGFAAKDSNGKDPNLKPNVIFTEVKDKEIAGEWKQLFSKYK
nr:hypothetical protein [Mammaliicoccus sp. Marseille-Q6498]